MNNKTIVSVQTIKDYESLGGTYALFNDDDYIQLTDSKNVVVNKINSDYKLQILKVIIDKMSNLEFNEDDNLWTKSVFNSILDKNNMQFEQLLNKLFNKVLYLYRRPQKSIEEILSINAFLDKKISKENYNQLPIRYQIQKKICYI